MLPAAGARAAAPPDAFAFFAHNFAAGARLPLPHGPGRCGPGGSHVRVSASASARRPSASAAHKRSALICLFVRSLVRRCLCLFACALALTSGGARVFCWRAESVRALLRFCRARGRGCQLLQRVGRSAPRVLGGGGSPDSRLRLLKAAAGDVVAAGLWHWWRAAWWDCANGLDWGGLDWTMTRNRNLTA